VSRLRPNRQVHFNGYGIAFTKTFARRWGANPVWYLDQTPPATNGSPTSSTSCATRQSRPRSALAAR
jgi:hypothetical protein